MTRLNLIVEPEEAVVRVKVVEISTLLCISIPIVSLLADMAIGTAIVSVCEKSLPLTNATIHYTQLILVVPQYVLLGAFIATAVPLRIDQMPQWSSF